MWRIEAVLQTAVLLPDQFGERGPAMTAIPVATEPAAIVGLHDEWAEVDAAALLVSQQAVGEQQGVAGVVDGAEGQPDAAFGHHAGGELAAGQAERSPADLLRGQFARRRLRPC